MRMNRIIAFIFTSLIAGGAFAQEAIRNDTPTVIYGADLTTGRSVAVDSFGQQKIGTITPGTAATNLGKAESSAHASGDTGVACWAVRNDTLATSFASNGQYSPISVTSQGAVSVSLTTDAQESTVRGIMKTEDVASTDAAVGVASLYVTQDPLSVDQGSSSDYAIAKVDRAGRVITTLAPAGETFQSCSASNTGTSDVAIKAAVASNRIYVTSISCFNTAAVASSIVIKDGATQIYVGGIGNSTLNGVASWNVTLPVPLRGTVNTALNFAMGTTATATTCCAAGYVSVN